MSYAEAAASSGPTGAEKLPNPPVHTEREKVEPEIDQDYQELKAKAQKLADEGKDKYSQLEKDGKAKLHQLEKDGKAKLNELEEETKSAVNNIYQWVKEQLIYIDQNLGGIGGSIVGNSTFYLTKFYQELNNPVVVAQTIVGLVGLGAGYVAYKDRYRIDTDNNVVLGIHAGVITGLVLTDRWLFNKYYPQFEKSKAVRDAEAQKNAKEMEAKTKAKIEKEQKKFQK